MVPNEIHKQYVETINLLEDLYSFHPEYFAKLTSEEMKDLSDYYFAGREVDVEDVKAYCKSILAKDPGLGVRAEKALRHFNEMASIRGIGVVLLMQKALNLTFNR